MTKQLYVLCLLTALITSPLSAKNQVEERLNELEQTLAMRGEYDRVKRHRIDSLIQQSYLSDSPQICYQNLYEEYKSFNYDTALIYADRLGDEVSRAFVYLSGGMFHEAYELLSSLHTDNSDMYLLTYARLLYDMCDYAGAAEVSGRYSEQANGLMLELAMRYQPSDSARYWYPLAVIDLHEQQFERSIVRMEEALRDSRITLHQRAIMVSTLAFLYKSTGNNEAALERAIEAAICDIRSSTYETVALRMVAEWLYERGDIELANRYIHIAMDDANQYHARHRQVSISQLMPIIEHHYTERLRRQTTIAYVLLAVVLVLFLLGVAGIILLLKRHRAIRTARQIIDEMNQNLTIANHVKEQLLGSLVAGHSQYLSAVEQYQNNVKNSVVNRRLNELMSIPKNVDARLQRQVLNRRLDEMLLSIFPSFVTDFNALLKPEYRVEFNKDELLTPSLRIFALIRLGIMHNEVIAEILDYSVNTVYTYKTRTVNQSDLSPEEFYAALMRIK
ncbi:MAG: hypothetical protein J5761_00950 [Paludibacteraceae bacterium]|nr:hypothetical protein [Paludibacteraceae bacterium]